LNSKAQQGFREQRNKKGISIETQDVQWHCGPGFALGAQTRRRQPEKILRRGILGRVWQRPALKEAILGGYKHMHMFLSNSIFKHLGMLAVKGELYCYMWKALAFGGTGDILISSRSP